MPKNQFEVLLTDGYMELGVTKGTPIKITNSGEEIDCLLYTSRRRHAELARRAGMEQRPRGHDRRVVPGLFAICLLYTSRTISVKRGACYAGIHPRAAAPEKLHSAPAQ